MNLKYLDQRGTKKIELPDGSYSGNIILRIISYFTQKLRKKCLYSELLWSIFFHIWTEYKDIRSISSYSVLMQENMDQNNSEYGHFSSSEIFRTILCIQSKSIKHLLMITL